MKTIEILVCLAVLLSTTSPRMSAAGKREPDVPPPGEILATLRPDHPRVMARADTFEHIRSLVAQGGLPAKLLAEVDGKTFTAQLQEPTGAAFEVMDCKPLPSSPNPEPQTSNAGRRKLAVHLRGVENTRVQVTMAP